MGKYIGNYIVVYMDHNGEDQVIEVPAYSRTQAVFLAEQDEDVEQIVDVECASVNLMA